jgi:hypothetical protein
LSSLGICGCEKSLSMTMPSTRRASSIWPPTLPSTWAAAAAGLAGFAVGYQQQAGAARARRAAGRGAIQLQGQAAARHVHSAPGRG